MRTCISPLTGAELLKMLQKSVLNPLKTCHCNQVWNQLELPDSGIIQLKTLSRLQQLQLCWSQSRRPFSSSCLLISCQCLLQEELNRKSAHEGVWEVEPADSQPCRAEWRRMGMGWADDRQTSRTPIQWESGMARLPHAACL